MADNLNDEAMNVQGQILCPFCQGITVLVYQMGSYHVLQCRTCGTGQVFPMPADTELQKFYKGFLFCADLRNLATIIKTGSKLFASLNLLRNGRLKMLDIGGGGGFYAKAFEISGYGESTYIDLDSEACRFAKEKVGLRRILNQDVAMLDTEDCKYDFIMCRHLIEHLINPTGFILKIFDLIEKGGTILIVCPNGDSLEYFAYPQSNLKNRMKKIGISSGFSKFKVMQKLLNGKMLHGIDPPRHLWAISRKGMRRFLEINGITAEMATFPLTDPMYSPYFASRTLTQKACSFLGGMITAKIAGGTHLSVVIRKPI